MTARYRTKPREIVAHRWTGWPGPKSDIVKLDSRGTRGDQPTLCSGCGHPHHDHGEIETKQGLVTVCPGDWLITTVDGETYPCKPDVFERNYEKAE